MDNKTIDANKTPAAVQTPVQTAPVQTVQISQDETSAVVRFIKVNSKSDKSPVLHCQLALSGMFKGLVIEAPVFKRDNEYSIGLPGGRFAALKAANKVIAMPDGREFILQEQDELGSKKLDRWEPAIKTALLEYLHTGKAEQRVTF